MAYPDHQVVFARELLARMSANKVAKLTGMSRDTVQRIARGTYDHGAPVQRLTAPDRCSVCGRMKFDGSCVRCRAIAANVDAREVRRAIATLPRQEVLKIVAQNSPRFRRPTSARVLTHLPDPFTC